MPFLNKQDLNTIVIDFTSHCNAMCGNCSRNIDGVKVNPHMPLGHMDMDTFKILWIMQKGLKKLFLMVHMAIH